MSEPSELPKTEMSGDIEVDVGVTSESMQADHTENNPDKDVPPNKRPRIQFETEDDLDVIEKQGYEVISVDSVLAYMVEESKSMCDVLRLTVTEMRILLDAKNFHMDRLIEDIFDEEFLANVGISLAKDIQVEEHVPEEYNFECMICLQNTARTNLMKLNCMHAVCRECCRKYIINSVLNGRKFVVCMNEKCNVVFDDKTVLELLNEKIATIYKLNVSEMYLKANNLMLCEWCGRVFQVFKDGVTQIKCKCGTKSCFSCQQSCHEPLPCDLMKEYCGLHDEPPPSLKWILKHSKKCPSCEEYIEKNGGCSHMICKCNHEFCFTCLQPWFNHNSAECKPSEVIVEKLSLLNQRKKDMFLDCDARYTHFKNLLLNLDHSKEQEIYKQQKVLRDMVQYLAYLQVFMKYTKDSPQKEHIEFNMQTAVPFIEDVVKYFNSSCRTDEDMDLKLKSAEKYFMSITSPINDGFVKNAWEFESVV